MYCSKIYSECNNFLTYYRLNIIKHAFDSSFVKNSRPGAKINDVNIVLQFLVDVMCAVL